MDPSGLLLRSKLEAQIHAGGIEPLVFGQYGELSESFEGLINTLAVKRCDQAAGHCLLDVGPGAASVQKRLLLRQHVTGPPKNPRGRPPQTSGPVDSTCSSVQST